MKPKVQNKTAARHLVDSLVAQGVDRVFCVPGESYLAVLDALADVQDRIAVVTFPGDRLSPHVRTDGQMGGPDR